MPPFLPIISLDRSQNVRVGRGPGNAVPTVLNPTKQSGGARSAFYADLATGEVRRDLQRHNTLGAVEQVGSTSLTVTSDLFKLSGSLAVTAGTGFALNVAAGSLQSRTFGDYVGVTATSVTPAAPPSFGGRTDYVVVNNAGTVYVVPGPQDSVAPTYEVQSFATATGTVTAGTFVYRFRWNGFLFTTGTIAYNAAGSAIATAMLAATGGPNNVALSALAGSGTLTGGGTALPTGPATVTASGGLEGQITPVVLDSTGLTGGTLSVTETTVGSGAPAPYPAGNAQVLASVYIPSTATSSSNYVINSATLPTS